VPIEDIGVLILATTAASYTHAVLTRLLSGGAVIVACDDDHLPCGLLLPQTAALQTQRLSRQVEATKPLRKRLWKQIVVAKITHQADVLVHSPVVARALRAMRTHVRAGDPTNVEAQAARRYCQAMFGKAFRRNRKGAAPNNLLNYGYMAVRAAVARSLACAGLHPSLGLHHHNRSNSFPLADDLVEPLRALVDRRVRRLYSQGARKLDKDVRRELLGVLHETVRLGEGTGPLMVALDRTVASLCACYAGQRRKLDIPCPCNLADTDSCGCS